MKRMLVLSLVSVFACAAAYAADTKDTISTGTRVVVIEYFPPRTVVVSPM